MRRYKKIVETKFKRGNYSLVPIRDEDKYDILNWRNEQIEILRQEKPLTRIQQEAYFKDVVDLLFIDVYPKQLLFSFLEKENLIGYGGLVHINWEESTAEVSFLTETSRTQNSEMFINDWKAYLDLLKQIANECLNFKSIYTYAYDIRPALYVALDASGFIETNRIKNEIEIKGKLRDVVIHTYFMEPLSLCLANEGDVNLYFEWANDPEVRKFSFQQDIIDYESHVNWFKSKLSDPAYVFYLFKNMKQQAVAQVRIHRSEKETIVGISVDSKHRGKGYGRKALRMACQKYFETAASTTINAYIKEENKSSIRIFKGAGFEPMETLKIKNSSAIKFILKDEKN